MRFKCIKSDGFTIRYEDTYYLDWVEIGIVNERSNPEYVFEYDTFGYDPGVIDIKTIPIDNTIEWECVGTCLFVDERKDPLTVYWSSRFFKQNNTNFEVVTSSNGVPSLKGETIRYEEDGYVYEEEQIRPLYTITKEEYDYYLENSKAPSTSSRGRSIRDEQAQQGYSGIANVEIVHSVVARGLQWEFLVYLNDDLIIEGTVRSLLESPFTEPPWKIRSEADSAKVDREKIFTKEVNTQVAEVLPDSLESNKRILYLVTLDDQGEEVSIASVLSFHTEPEDSPPRYEIICSPSQNECPEGTCPVDCDSHVCCYGSDGISVFAYEN